MPDRPMAGEKPAGGPPAAVSAAARDGPAPPASAEAAWPASAEGAGGRASEDEARPADLARRRFFRQFGGEVVHTAASVVGAAQALRDASAQAAQAILDPAEGGAMLGAPAIPGSGKAAGGAPASRAGHGLAEGAPRGFRTPFRFGDRDDVLLVVDQRRLPDELVEVEVRSATDAVVAIRDMVVRGAPAIGQVAAIGLALAAHRTRSSQPAARRATLRTAATALRSARPTAASPGWATDRLMARYEALDASGADGEAVADALRAEADAIVWAATTDHGRIADVGLTVLPRPDGRPLRILTHGNTGPLGSGQYGTALGIVQAAHHADWRLHVWVAETRPHLDGARLTGWELAQAGVPHTLVADAAAGFLMQHGEVDVVLVGADRIAANGDTAGDVGTYPLAVVAQRHEVPFLVVAPLSAADPSTPAGEAIPIEERAAHEVVTLAGRRIAPPATRARNPAADVTPAELISAIVTEEGALRPPLGPALEDALARAAARHGAQPPLLGPVSARAPQRAGA